MVKYNIRRIIVLKKNKNVKNKALIESYLNDCKIYFESLGSEDWNWCHECHRLGYKCFNVCGVAMKVLHNNGLLNSVTSFGRERIVSADEYIDEGINGSKSLEEYVDELEAERLDTSLDRILNEENDD